MIFSSSGHGSQTLVDLAASQTAESSCSVVMNLNSPACSSCLWCLIKPDQVSSSLLRAAGSVFCFCGGRKRKQQLDSWSPRSGSDGEHELLLCCFTPLVNIKKRVYRWKWFFTPSSCLLCQSALMTDMLTSDSDRLLFLCSLLIYTETDF